VTIVKNKKRIQDEQIPNRMSKKNPGKIISKGHGQNEIPERKYQKAASKAVVLRN
jgi:hypothetical protein